jgi:phage shock protein C
MTKTKRLYKGKEKLLSGVCSGIAEYFNVDPTLIRVGYILLTIFTGFFPGLIAYIILAVIMLDK